MFKVEVSFSDEEFKNFMVQEDQSDFLDAHCHHGRGDYLATQRLRSY